MSILDEATQMFNSGEIRNNEQAISRTTNLIGKFEEVLMRKKENKNKPTVTPAEIAKAGRQVIEDVKSMFREEAGNVPDDMLYQNHESMLEEAMNSLNTITNNRNEMEQNIKSQAVQTQNNEGMDR